MLQNEDASVKYCQDKLEQLSKSLMEAISAGMFSVPGGHKLYMETKGKIEQDYCQVPKKGVKVRNKGSIGSYRLKSRGSPGNWSQHWLWVI